MRSYDIKIQGISKDALRVLDIIKDSKDNNLTKDKLDILYHKEYEHIEDTKYILQVLEFRRLIYITKGIIELI